MVIDFPIKTVTLSSMNLENVTSINGKELTKPEQNLLKKLATKHGVVGYDITCNVQNPFSGEGVVLDGVTAALVHFIYYVPNLGFVVGGQNVAIQDFDRTRYLVQRVNRDAYYTLLD